MSSQIRPDGDIVLADDLVADFVQPTCPRCDSDKVKPDVVFFGGSVPKERVDHCFALTDAAPALLVLGSSLQVMSGFGSCDERPRAAYLAWRSPAAPREPKTCSPTTSMHRWGRR